MSRPENIDRADPIGIVLEAACNAGEPFLGPPVLRRDMVALRTSPARILRRYEDQLTPVPRQLVLQLAAELEPPLIEDGFVQSGLGPDILTRSFNGTGRRPGHVSHLQVLDTHHRVVLADRGRGLVKVVAARVSDTGMDTLDTASRLVPVVAELLFAAHRLLPFA